MHPAALTCWWSEHPHGEPHWTALVASRCLKAGKEEEEGWFAPELSSCYETGMSPGHTSEPVNLEGLLSPPVGDSHDCF